MPLTAKGHEILSSMTKEYGEKKGKSVFYASANAGKISGVHEGEDKLEDAMEEEYVGDTKKRPVTVVVRIK